MVASREMLIATSDNGQTSAGLTTDGKLLHAVDRLIENPHPEQTLQPLDDRIGVLCQQQTEERTEQRCPWCR